MKYAIIIAAVLAFHYIILIAAPSILAFFIVFGRRKPKLFEEQSLEGTPYAPYKEDFARARKALAAFPCEGIGIAARDGTTLHAVLFDVGSDVTLICFHGYNSSGMNNFSLHAEFFCSRGFNVLLTDERAHGNSGGKRSGLGLLEKQDVLCWIRAIKRRFPEGKIVLYGISMGASSLLFASPEIGENDAACMIIDCGFAVPYDLIRANFKRMKLPVALMMPYVTFCAKRILRVDIRQSAADAVKKSRIPALFLYGDRDAIVPAAVGRTLYESCASEKEWICAPGADHTLSFASSEEIRNGVLNFVKDHTINRETTPSGGISK